MYAIREIADIKNNIINIHIPNDFPSDKAEIIILPLNNPNKNSKDKKLDLPDLISIVNNNYASAIILEERR